MLRPSIGRLPSLRRRASSSLSRYLPSNRPEWPGHAAFILTGLSFASPSELSLRVLATCSCSLACLFNFYHPVGKPLWLPLRWNGLYLGLNAFYAGLLIREQQLTLTDSERRDYHIFEGSMRPGEIRKLIALGVETSKSEQEVTVLRRGRPNDTLVLLLDGVAVIDVDGVSFERRGGLFGEVSFLHGEPASATVRLQPGCRYVSWTREVTQRQLNEHARRGFEHAISHEVTKHLAATTRKMVAATRSSERGAASPTVLRRSGGPPMPMWRLTHGRSQEERRASGDVD